MQHGLAQKCTIYSESKLPLSLSVVYTRTFIFLVVSSLKMSDFYVRAVWAYKWTSCSAVLAVPSPSSDADEHKA